MKTETLDRGSLDALVRALDLGSQNSAGEREVETFVCCWAEHGHCTEEATHFHKAFGELCPTHAAEVMRLRAKDKVVRILVGVYGASFVQP